MANRLFVAYLKDNSDARDSSHQFLAEYLKTHPGSPAECRENSGLGEYEVWDGPQPLTEQQPAVSESTFEALVDRLAERMKKALRP